VVPLLAPFLLVSVDKYRQFAGGGEYCMRLGWDEIKRRAVAQK
jgi:hypothetical protein